MAIAVVQKASRTPLNSTGTTLTATFAAPPTTGNLLVLAIGTAAAGGQTLTLPAGWAHVTSMPQDANGNPSPFGSRGVTFAWKIAGVAEPSAVTVTAGASTNIDMVVVEVSGIDAVSPLDQQETTFKTDNNGALANAFFDCGTTGTTDTADEIAFAYCCNANRTGEAFDNGFTMQNADTSRVMLGSKILSATGTVHTTATWLVTGNSSVGGIVTFRAPAGSTPISSSDTTTVAETEAVAVAVADGDTTSIADVESIAAGVVDSDATSVAEGEATAAAIADAESTSVADDATAGVAATDGDTTSVTDTEAVVVQISDSDGFGVVDGGESIGAAVTDSDATGVADTEGTVVMTVDSDGVTFTDSLSGLTAQISDSDAASFLEAEALAVAIAVADDLVVVDDATTDHPVIPVAGCLNGQVTSGHVAGEVGDTDRVAGAMSGAHLTGVVAGAMVAGRVIDAGTVSGTVEDC